MSKQIFLDLLHVMLLIHSLTKAAIFFSNFQMINLSGTWLGIWRSRLTQSPKLILGYCLAQHNQAFIPYEGC